MMNYALGPVHQGTPKASQIPTKETFAWKSSGVGPEIFSRQPGRGVATRSGQSGQQSTSKKAEPARKPGWLSQLVLRDPQLYPDRHYYDTSNVLDAALKAYNLHPKRQNISVGSKPTEATVLMAVHQKLEEFASEQGFDLMYIEDNNTIKVGLVETLFEANENLTAEVGRLLKLEKRRKKQFHIITSLLRHLMWNSHIPDWSVMIDHAEGELETMKSIEQDEEEVDTEFQEAFSASVAEYKTGTPSEFLSRLQKYKSLSVDELSKIKISDPLLKRIVRSGVEVIKHPLGFDDYCNILNDDDGLHPYSYVNFSFDFDSIVEREFMNYLDNYGGQVGAIYPRRIIFIEESKDWNATAYGYSFFNPLCTFMTSLNQYLTNGAR